MRRFIAMASLLTRGEMRRIIACFSLVAASVTLVGCGSDGPAAPTQASIAGTWNLTTINGSPLPYTIQAANPKVEYLSEQLILSGSGTFTQTSSARFTNNGVVSTQTITDAGTFTVNGTAVSFRFNSSATTGTATLSGNTMTVAEDGQSGVYTKQ